MANNTISIERRFLPERRSLADRRSLVDSCLITERSIVKQIRKSTPFSVAFDFLSLIVVAAIALSVYIATGFYGSVTSPVAHVILGGGIFIYFLIMMRRGLNRDIFGFRALWQRGGTTHT
jgi:hypothetical protein